MGRSYSVSDGWDKPTALSQFALLTGNRCINCHVSTQGGAQRDELGQYSMDGVGVLAPNYVLPGKTAFADGLLLLGADVRGQMARSQVSPRRRAAGVSNAGRAVWRRAALQCPQG